MSELKMSNKEAKMLLSHNYMYKELIDNAYQYEALLIAIKALEFIDENHPKMQLWRHNEIKGDINNG